MSLLSVRGLMKMIQYMGEDSHMKQMECLLKILNEIPEGDQSGRSIKDTKTPKSKQGLGKLKK